MIVLQDADGQYRLYRRMTGINREKNKSREYRKNYRNWWIVKDHGLTVGEIVFPKELYGRKIRIVIEQE